MNSFAQAPEPHAHLLAASVLTIEVLAPRTRLEANSESRISFDKDPAVADDLVAQERGCVVEQHDVDAFARHHAAQRSGQPEDRVLLRTRILYLALLDEDGDVVVTLGSRPFLGSRAEEIREADTPRSEKGLPKLRHEIMVDRYHGGSRILHPGGPSDPGHTSRRAAVIGMREARQAGSSPPKTPIETATTRPMTMERCVMRNENASSLN